MSDSSVPVLAITLQPHPDPDTTALALVAVKGYTVVVKRAEWHDGDLAAFIRPDMVFEGERVIVRKLRGVRSQGLLVPAPEGAAEGDDVAEALGVVPYVAPELQVEGGENVTPPALDIPTYDVERLQNNLDIFTPGEEVSVTEKIDGTNVRVVFWDGKLYVGSRNCWKRAAQGQQHWKAVRSVPGLALFAQENPGLCVIGEGYGWVAKWRYGHEPGSVSFAAFDIWDANVGRYLNYDDARTLLDAYGIPRVPEVYRGPYDEEMIMALAEGATLIPNAEHIREGVVLRAVCERVAQDHGRAVRKVVADEYIAAKHVKLPRPERVLAFNPDELDAAYCSQLEKLLLRDYSGKTPNDAVAEALDIAARIATGMFRTAARKAA